jgi:non-specific serine/threonine protein kinase/serine/threonine-protein kinase
MADPPQELPERIGPYRVLQLLGQGGMGAVYEAEESDAVRRRVAIKVVRAGQNSREVVARFEAERQALALMNHPGIARVLHAGTTDAGELYFTMELVRGLPITEYCDLHRLSIGDRIQLFIDACRAVQHAHQKGVVHRDLKPSNILVSEQDGVRQPKIIDFGVAKAIGQQLTQHALVTLSGTAIGTAAYMSPEQADTTMDVDTRSDIYSLGVILYELMVGALPMEPEKGGVHIFLARIASRQTDPPTPSSKVSGVHDSGAVAYSRRTDLKHLRRELSGDLDSIVMMAMQPDRSLRYPTATSLADDLRRHLEHQPVVARPASTADRVVKFVRRHRVGAASAAVVTVAILAGAVLTTVGFVRARRAERVAAQEAAASQQVTKFLTELFNANDPGRARGLTLTGRELLARGAARIATELSGQPLLQARLMQTLGAVHHQLGLYDEARALFADALRIRERELGRNDLLVAETLRGMSDVARATGQLDLADTVLQRSLAIRTAKLAPGHPDVLSTMGALAALRYLQGRAQQAESLFVYVLAAYDSTPHPDTLRAVMMRSLGTVYWSQHRYAEAEPLLRGALEIQERVLGPDHWAVSASRNNLGGLYYSMGRYNDALQAYERALIVAEKSLGPAHPNVLGLYNNIGETYWKLSRRAEAESLLRKALAGKEKVFPPGDARVATTLHALGGVLRDEGRFREAEAYYRRALAIREQAPGNSQEAVETLRDYAELMRRSGRAAEGARLEARAKVLQAPRAK